MKSRGENHYFKVPGMVDRDANYPPHSFLPDKYETITFNCFVILRGLIHRFFIFQSTLSILFLKSQTSRAESVLAHIFFQLYLKVALIVRIKSIISPPKTKANTQIDRKASFNKSPTSSKKRDFLINA